MEKSLITIDTPTTLQRAELCDFANAIHTTIYYRKGTEIFTKQLQGYFKPAFDFQKFGLENVNHQSIILESYDSDVITSGSVCGHSYDAGMFVKLFKVVS